MTHNQSRDSVRDSATMTKRERWAYRIALGSMVVFTLLGIYVLYFPSEGLIALFAIMMLLTLVIGAISGLIAAGASEGLPHPPAPSPRAERGRQVGDASDAATLSETSLLSPPES